MSFFLFKYWLDKNSFLAMFGKLNNQFRLFTSQTSVNLIRNNISSYVATEIDSATEIFFRKLILNLIVIEDQYL